MKHLPVAVLFCAIFQLNPTLAVSPPGPTDVLPFEDDARSAREKCQGSKMTRLEPEIERKLFGHEHLEPHQIEYHALCLCIEMGLMKITGEVSQENVKSHLARVIRDEAALQRQLERCIEAGPTALQTSMHLFFCLHDAMMTHHDLYSQNGIPLFGPKALDYGSPLNTAATQPNPNTIITNDTSKSTAASNSAAGSNSTVDSDSTAGSNSTAASK
ncbi:unnamed protein product [Phyllotreta striolata]|uniref:Uncharacterized protein n=1 Tax=Phyllotreta striolata TaxID=444603 RepID=A0A9N9TLW5_PHYSR|nr:unnamed protein product [Phyllotreta striolata]